MHFGRGQSLLNLIFVMLFAGVLSACSPLSIPDNSSNTNSNPTQSSESGYCLTRPTYTGGVTITGNAQFYYRPVAVNVGLSGNPTALGIPFSEIQVVNSAGTTVQCSETAADGTFSLVVPAGTDSYSLRVSSRSDTTALKVSVNEDYYANQPYQISKSFSVTNGQTSVAIGTVSAYARLSESAKMEGAAFNILYQIWQANVYLRATTANASFVAPKVTVYWKKGYNPYNYFGGTSPLSFYRPGNRELFILGGDGGAVHNVDTDHFDNSVILHEYGHFLEDVYAKSDSPGGSHNGNFIIDPRLAWSEGWANFFQAAVLKQSDSTWRYYIDTYGFKNDTTETNGSGGLSIKIELSISGASGLCASTPAPFSGYYCDPVGVNGEGTFREMSISRYLFKTIRDVVDGGAGIPFSALWKAFSLGDVSGSPVGLASSQVKFRSIGRFNEFLATIITDDHSALAAGWNGILTNEKQNKTTHDYADNLTRMTENTCTVINLAPVIDGTFAGTSRSNLLRSNDFYYFYHDGVAKSISLTYTGGSTHIDLDLFLYKENYIYQETWQSENGTIAARSARPFISENGSESMSLTGLAAGYYLINVKAYTLNKTSGNFGGQSADYRLKVSQAGTTEDLCPAH